MIIGGGVIGTAIAWRAARAGMSVSIVDDAPGRGASWVAAGMLAPVTEVHYGEETLLQLNLAGAARFESFVAELERDSQVAAGYERCGTLVVARDADDHAALDDLYRFQIGLGLDATRLRGSEVRAMEPGVTPRVRSGIWAPHDHHVDPRAFTAALRIGGERAGVSLVPGRVAEVRRRNGSVSGVALADGTEVAAPLVVLAAGCWSASIGGVNELRLPVRPVKGQLLHLRALDGAPVVSHTIRGLDVYLVQRRDGRMVVGATMEEKGFDTSVTAGAVLQLLRDGTELVPGIEELEVVETIAGLRPGTPDNAPLLGPASIDGLVVATGHYRNGILLAPVTADAIVEAMVSGTVPASIAPFSPDRFAAGALR